ncbi:cupin domain-containing protein [Lysobacter sp. Root983]|uniref:cupin domain-containing protein n=1 Tax=Lysobacter sp. Root983 TaxID=1736613 RepID=UPI0009EA3FDC|nr:cupin domain-containing protein [Lysobacter sp. Root983]
MRKQRWSQLVCLLAFAWCVGVAQAASPACAPRSGSYVEQARDLAVEQPGPHEGQGRTTAYPFFEQAADFDLVFRQRALHRGASIGEHRNDKDEIYYVLSGRGELMLDEARREVGPGDAILTRKGSTHGLKQLGEQDLVIVVVYRRVQPAGC